MRCWHQDLPLMTRRWKEELRKHDLDPAPYIGAYLRGESVCATVCHCEKGPGVLRKRAPLGLRARALWPVSLVEEISNSIAATPHSVGANT